MKQFSDLKAALAAIDERTNELAVTIGEVVTNEGVQIAMIKALQDQIAAGTPVTPEQLDQVVAEAENRALRLGELGETLKAIAADPNQPVPEPVPTPEPEPTPGEGSGGEGEAGNGDAGAGVEGATDGSSDAPSDNSSGVNIAGNQSTARPASASRKGGLRTTDDA